jgi:hypothetical protein
MEQAHLHMLNTEMGKDHWQTPHPRKPVGLGDFDQTGVHAVALSAVEAARSPN